MEEVLWWRLAELAPGRLRQLKLFAILQGVGWAVLLALLISTVYVTVPKAALVTLLVVAGIGVISGIVFYLLERAAARHLVCHRYRKRSLPFEGTLPPA